MKIRILSLAILAVSILGSTASAQLTNFFEDFEGLDRTSSNVLADAGWNGAAAGITPRVVGSNFSLILVHPTTFSNNVRFQLLTLEIRLSLAGLPMEMRFPQLVIRSPKPLRLHWIQTTTSLRPTSLILTRLRLLTVLSQSTH